MSSFGVRRTAYGAIGLAVTGALALTGCQNGDDNGGGKDASTPPAIGSTPPTHSAQPSAPAPAGGGGTAKAGQSFKIGEAAQIPFSHGTTTKGTIALTVTSIDQGQPGDLAPLKLGDKVRGKVPYYVRYSIKNTGTTDLAYASVGHIKGLLGDGTEAQDLMVIGTFDKCPSDSLPKGFTNGHTATGCAVALAPSAATKVASAEYWGDPYTLGKGLTWK
uniref:Lipoprotein n=1 Tax=Streptomyces sp. NBC_00003 TaxID=2903608 RepID=A0AAU2VFK9_9ACTN